MATKLYLRDDAYQPVSGTLPSGEQDSQTPSFSLTGASTLKEAVTAVKGSSMTFMGGSSLASSSAQAGFLGMWASAPLSGAQTVGGASQTAQINVADYENNLAANFCCNRAHIYVWRPSTNSLVGDCCTYATSPSAGSPSEASSASSVQTTIFTVNLASVSAADGDVIVIELWASFNQTNATARTVRLYYDGATETTVENTVVADHAAFVDFSQTFTFTNGQASLHRQHAITLYEDDIAGESRLLRQYAIVFYIKKSGPPVKQAQSLSNQIYTSMLVR